VNGLPLIVGVLRRARPDGALAKDVMDAGAGGVMVAPPRTLKTDDQIVAYYAQLRGHRPRLPFVLQDYPYASGRLHGAVRHQAHRRRQSSCKMVKHEEWPGWKQADRAEDMIADTSMRKVGSCAATARSLPHELERGADGANTAMRIRNLVQLVKLIKAGDRTRRATTCSTGTCRCCAMSKQPGMLGLAVRKYIPSGAARLASDAQRSPHQAGERGDHRDRVPDRAAGANN